MGEREGWEKKEKRVIQACEKDKNEGEGAKKCVTWADKKDKIKGGGEKTSNKHTEAAESARAARGKTSPSKPSVRIVLLPRVAMRWVAKACKMKTERNKPRQF